MPGSMSEQDAVIRINGQYSLLAKRAINNNKGTKPELARGFVPFCCRCVSTVVNIDLKQIYADCEFYWEACLPRSAARHLEQLGKCYLEERAVCGLHQCRRTKTSHAAYLGIPVPSPHGCVSESAVLVAVLFIYIEGSGYCDVTTNFRIIIWISVISSKLKFYTL